MARVGDCHASAQSIHSPAVRNWSCLGDGCDFDYGRDRLSDGVTGNIPANDRPFDCVQRLLNVVCNRDFRRDADRLVRGVLDLDLSLVDGRSALVSTGRMHGARSPT